MRQWVGGLGVAANRPEVQVRLVVRPLAGRQRSAGLGSRTRLAPAPPPRARRPYRSVRSHARQGRSRPLIQVKLTRMQRAYCIATAGKQGDAPSLPAEEVKSAAVPKDIPRP